MARTTKSMFTDEELEQLVERCTLMSDGPLVLPEDLPDDLHPAQGGGDPEKTHSIEPVDLLYSKVVKEGKPFWKTVHEPFLRRKVSREAMGRLIRRGYDEAGSYKEMARLFGIESDYRKFLNFLYYHDLRIEKD